MSFRPLPGIHGFRRGRLGFLARRRDPSFRPLPGIHGFRSLGSARSTAPTPSSFRPLPGIHGFRRGDNPSRAPGCYGVSVPFRGFTVFGAIRIQGGWGVYYTVSVPFRGFTVFGALACPTATPSSTASFRPLPGIHGFRSHCYPWLVAH